MEGQNKQKVGFVISTLTSGGAERSLVNLSGELAARGLDVVVLTYSDSTSDFYTLDKRVQRLELGLMQKSGNKLVAVSNNFKRILKVRTALNEEQCDVVVSFMDATNITTVLASLGLPSKVVISERIHPGFHQAGRAWALVRKYVYGLADEVVVQTQQIADWVVDNTNAKSVKVIPNFLTNIEQKTHPHATAHRKRIIAAGRLNHQKGFDLLLVAFQLTAEQPEMEGWTLDIFGEGPERKTLQDKIYQLGLKSRVRLLGRSEQLAAEMQDCGVFVLSSVNEGFPNVLLEAMREGCAVCGFATVSGVPELIEDNVSGLLMQNRTQEELSEVLLKLCADANLRQKLSNGARRHVQQFAVENIIPRWFDVLDIKRRNTYL